MKTQFLAFLSIVLVSQFAAAKSVEVDLDAFHRPQQRWTDFAQTAGTAATPTPAASEPVPIRMAKADVVLTKTWNEKQMDGSFKKMSQEVCRFTDQVPVFEIQGASLNYNPATPHQCKTDLKVGPSTVSFFSIVALLDNVDDPFRPGTTENLKGFLGTFWVTNQKGDFAKMGPIAVSAVENLSEKVMILQDNSSELTSNSDGDVKLDENLQMDVRIED